MTERRALLEHVEGVIRDAGEDAGAAALAYIAAQEVHLPEEELNAALRRAMLLVAAGGDPHRALQPDGRAVRALAEDLDAPPRRSELSAALDALAAAAAGLEGVTTVVARLRGDEDLGWRWLACALLAAATSDEGEA